MTKKVVEFPDRHAVEEEAATWLIRLDGDERLPPQDLKRLRRWLGRSPVHREELVKLARLWDRLNVLTELAVPLGRHEAPPTAGFVQRLRWGKRYLAYLGIAAAVIVLSSTAALTLWPRTDPLAASNGLYATAVGQQRTTVLADGSSIILNTNTRVKVEYGSGFRNVRLLQGEALFTVARNADEPFRVHAGNSRVEAVGTAFSVYLKDDEVDVMVTGGSVRLASLTPKVSRDGSADPDLPSDGMDVVLDEHYVEAPGTLDAGQRATLRGGGRNGSSQIGIVDIIRTEAAQDLSQLLAWRDGILMFSGESLEDVVAEVSRYTTDTIVIEDPEVRAIRIGGRFPIGDTDAMLDALESNFGLQVTRISHNRVMVSAAKN